MNNNLLKRIFSMIFRFFPQCRIYGLSVAFWSVVFPLHHVFRFLKPFFGIKKHKAILNYLYKRYSDIINSLLTSNTTPLFNIEPESTIWVCWWDGEEQMPSLVKICYNSILKYAGRHPVKFISKYNYKNFISIPDYIMEKVDKGIITITSFSDILRASLLYEYGGIWLDATILVLKDITLDNYHFFTLKAPGKSASVSLSRFSGIFNPSARIINNKMLNASRWSSFLLAGTKHSIIFEYIRNFYYAYWKDHNDQIDYMLVDFIIALGYDFIPNMKNAIDNVPCSPVEKFDMEKKLNNEYSDEYFKQFTETQFHKLTWKNKFSSVTKNGKQTIYGYLLENS